MTTASSLGSVVSQAWDDAQADEERRRLQQVTNLHDWRRARNGRWVEHGWHACPWRQSRWLSLMLTEHPRDYIFTEIS